MAETVSKVARIGKTLVDKAEPGVDRYTIWDDKLSGFGVRVSPGGAKTYIARYRAGGGRSGQLRQMTIGRHGQLTSDQARTAADKVISAASGSGRRPHEGACGSNRRRPLRTLLY